MLRGVSEADADALWRSTRPQLVEQTISAWRARPRSRPFRWTTLGRRMVAEDARAFRNRFSERETLEQLLHDARDGRSGVLVIRGDAGVGKSALLRYVAEQASGFRIVQIAGVESEMELPFAGLHQLCAPMLAQLDSLPPPQQRALRVALGLTSGAPPDRFLVALGALTLLAEIAEAQPLLCFVDDAQWLDEASRKVLGFVSRRLLAESVAIVFAVREPSVDRELAGLPELVLRGLGDDDARFLLSTVIPGRIDERVRDRILAETRGNPLALLELPRGLSAAQLAGGFGLPELLPLSGRIEESFLRRLEELPPQARVLLLVAAAEPLGDPALMWRAATRLGVARTALEPAVRSELLEVGAQVRFRHPLVRSAVYRSASDDERQSTHGALADETDAALEPDRRAWHRAQATEGPDEDVAAELERSAGRAQARGGLAAAAAFLGRAADLTIDPGRRTRGPRTCSSTALRWSSRRDVRRPRRCCRERLPRSPAARRPWTRCFVGGGWRRRPPSWGARPT
jgi:AAA ATPase domain